MKIIPNSDVLLINVPTSRSSRINKASARILSMPPLGLLYIASTLTSAGYTVSFIDLAIESTTGDNLIKKLSVINPKIIGISTYFNSWSAMKSLISIIKSYNSQIQVIGGGVCANFCSEKLINELGFDYVSLGEGENSFLGICNMILQEVNIMDCYGITYKDENGVIKSSEPIRIRDLDKLPIPDRSLLTLDKYVYPFTISTSRGCPGRCIFCSSSSFWGKKIYMRSIKSIIDEIKYLVLHFNAEEFFIVDDTFTMKPQRTKEFCEEMIKLDRQFIWGCESRADIIDRELLLIMYQAGCRKIQFGLESASNKVLASIKKSVTYEQVENATKIASKVGFDINISVIIGHAEDTHETIKHSIDCGRELKEKYNANVLYSINTPYPGTELYNNREKYGIELLTDNFDFYSTDNAIINTKYLTAGEIRYYYNKTLGIHKGF
ncbi:radical SAM protein [Clostridiaceae bacterium M8S5]|nr:radical SAM protein [Clostridiaceae bacterium M8S5]